MQTPKLTYSSVTSTLALFIALGGTSWAVATLPKGSVDTRELANGAVTGAKVKGGSLTHRDIRNGSLIGRDLLPGTLSSRQIGHGSLNGGDLANGSVDGRDIAAGSLRGEHLADGSVGLEKLAGLPQGVMSTDARLTDARRPEGPAGGDLTGTYPDPKLGNGTVGLPQVVDLLKDGAPGTPTLRSLGTGSSNAAAGDDARFPTTAEKSALQGTSGSPGGGNRYVTDADARLTDSRRPSGAAGGDLSGTYPNPTLRAGSVGSAEVANGALRLGDNAVHTLVATHATSGTLAARQCASNSVNVGFDVQAGDVLEAYGDETAHGVSVKYFGGVQDGTDRLDFLLCELAGVADAPYGGSVRLVLYRP